MEEKTEAIVLGLTRQKDNSSLLTLYTKMQGRCTYLLYGNKFKSHLSPMAWVEVTISRSKQVPAISQVSLSYIPQRIPNEVERQCVAMFMAEVVHVTMQHPMADEQVWDFLCHEVQRLDTHNDISSLPTDFMTNFSQLLGYGGAFLDEWHHLKSLEVIKRIF